MCQWPLTGITPNSVNRVRSAGVPTATTSRPRSGVGDPDQQRSSSPRPTPRPPCEGSHPELRQLVHRAEARHDDVADQLIVLLAHDEAAAGLRGDELDQRPLVAPVLAQFLLGAALVRGQQPAGPARGIPRRLAQLEHGLQVARATLAKGQLAH